jgi:peptidoglycan/LPS O-acetylase OafA/YrhL
MGVDLFFVLSGFLITYLLLQEREKFNSISLRLFYARRALRIWPLYFFVIAIASLYPLVHVAWDEAYAHYLQTLILPMVLFVGNFAIMNSAGEIGTFSRAYHLNPMFLVAVTLPFWSIAVEEQFYLIWPTMLLFIRSAKFAWISMATMFLIAVVSRLCIFLSVQNAPCNHDPYYMNTLTHLDGLMIGAAIATAEIRHNGWFAPFVRGHLPWLLCAVVVSILSAIVAWAPPISAKHISIVPVASALPLTFGLLLLLVMHWPPLRKAMSNPVLVWMGRISYSMYIFHMVCIFFVLKNIPVFSNNMFTCWSFIFLGCLALDLVVAQISWWLIEQPMNRLRHKFARTDAKA